MKKSKATEALRVVSEAERYTEEANAAIAPCFANARLFEIHEQRLAQLSRHSTE